MRLIVNIFKLIFFILKLIFQTAVFLAFAAVCIYIYARFIEPELLIVHEEIIQARTLNKEIKPFKIAQFSDTHLGEDYTIEHLRKIVQKINETQPDVIVFTGDLIDNSKEYGHIDEIILELSKLKAGKMKAAVYGNHDHGANGTKRYKMIMESAGFILLNNSQYSIDLGGGQKLTILGIDDLLLGRPDIKQTVKNINPNHYNLFLSHAPDIADDIKAYPIDLQLSGHSHGGQVKIPFLGAPLTPPYGQKYIKGMYQIEGNERMKLYVNSGLGTSQLRYRFLNIPEITVFTIKPSE